MARFRIGTSGWQYRHWRGLFYPRRLSQQAWLDYYMQRFETVEINSTFYRQPSNEAWDKWRAAAAPGFRYAVKANRFLTHVKRLREIEQPLERFLGGAARLQQHLGPLLFQTPPNFQRTPENSARLEALLERVPSRFESAVEFRHASWFVEPLYQLLARNGAGFCIADLKGLECPVRATASFAYVRFHGPSGTYGGSYATEALRDWAGRLRDLSRDLDEAWVYFNNDIGGHAPADAAQLRELLAA